MPVDRFSFSLTTFNKDGKLNQVEYATTAVAKNGESCIGIKAKNASVIIAEKRPKSILYIPDSIDKIEAINESIVMSFSGLSPDFKLLVTKAQNIAKDYKLKYMDDISPLVLVKGIAEVMQEFTQANGVRPFGTSLLIAGYQKSTNECCIYQCDPAGTYFAWNAVEIGENSDAYLKTLEQIYLNEMTVEEAIETALKVLNDKSSYTISAKSVDIAIVDNNGVDILSEEDKDVYIRQI